MKRIWIATILFLSILTISSQSYSQDEFPLLEGPYLGQRLPGSIPEPFAPGIVSTDNYELTGVFTPDMKEFYLIRNGGKYKKSSLVVFKNENNWTSQHSLDTF